MHKPFVPFLALPLALAIVPLAAGCNKSGPAADCTDPKVAGCVVASAKERATPSVPSSDLTTAVSDNTAFGLDLYRELSATAPNVIFSPYSISTALAMTYAGARNDTAKQMAQALHFSLPPERLHPAFDSLETSVVDHNNGHLSIANSLWGQMGTPFEAPFLDTLAVNYGTGMHIVDFVNAAEKGRSLINQWVSDHTNDKIQNILPEGSIDSSTRFVVANAVYFNGTWQYKFDPSATHNADFTLDDGTTVSVPTMVSSAISAPYTSDTDYQAVELPYADGTLGAVFILPKAGLDAFEQALTGDRLNSILGALAPSGEVEVALPKFTFDTAYDLINPLKNLGMVDAFTGAADFSGITTAESLSIGKVLHKAYIKLDEEGTEAAASTVVTGESMAIALPEQVNLNHPFLFMIREHTTNTVLFFGRIKDPRG